MDKISESNRKIMVLTNPVSERISSATSTSNDFFAFVDDFQFIAK